MKLGLSVPVAVTTIYAAGVVLAGAALLMSQLGPSVRIAGVVGLLAAAGAAVPLARVPVNMPGRSDASPGVPSHPETPATENGAVGGSLSAGGKKPIALP